MAKSKVIKSSTTPIVKGGTTKMFGQQHANPRKSLSQGGTAQVGKGTGGKFGKGGSHHMFGKQHASPRRSGVTGK